MRTAAALLSILALATMTAAANAKPPTTISGSKVVAFRGGTAGSESSSKTGVVTFTNASAGKGSKVATMRGEAERKIHKPSTSKQSVKKASKPKKTKSRRS